jgi:hypothetical protein
MSKEPYRFPEDKAVRLAGIAKAKFNADPNFYLDWMLANDCDLLLTDRSSKDKTVGLALAAEPSQKLHDGYPYKFRRDPARVDIEAFIRAPERFFELLKGASNQAEIPLGDGKRVVIYDDVIPFTFSHSPYLVRRVEQADSDIKAGRGRSMDEVIAEMKQEDAAHRRELLNEIRHSSPRQLAVMARTRGVPAAKQAAKDTVKHTGWTVRFRVKSTVHRVQNRVNPLEKRDQRLQRQLDTLAADVKSLGL